MQSGANERLTKAEQANELNFTEENLLACLPRRRALAVSAKAADELGLTTSAIQLHHQAHGDGAGRGAVYP